MNVVSRTLDQESFLRPNIRIPGSRTRQSEMASLMSFLLRLIDQRGPVVIYLTAASHGAGTTTIARELAAATSRWDWCKVALVDVCSWPVERDRQSMPLGLLDVADTDSALPFRQSFYAGTEVLEATLSGIKNSLPCVDTVRSLFDKLRKQFTLIIVDSPPVLESQQIATFSSVADCVVLVVEAEHTRAADLERARITLDRLGGRIMGVVLNKHHNRFPKFLRPKI